MSSEHFEALFEADADPWKTRSRWYERRKRALLMAALPRERYACAWEPGCGAGELTAALASRCDRVLASDASAAAVQHARRRLGAFGNVQVSQASMPAGQLPGHVDLVVLSELGYYLSEADWNRLIESCQSTLAGRGTLVACHWRRSAADMRQSAEAVHHALDTGCGLGHFAGYADNDFLLDVWTADERSVAQREGLA